MADEKKNTKNELDSRASMAYRKALVGYVTVEMQEEVEPDESNKSLYVRSMEWRNDKLYGTGAKALDSGNPPPPPPPPPNH